MNRLFHLYLSAIACAFTFTAWGADTPDGVTVKSDKVYTLRGDQSSELTDDLKFTFDVFVSTNGTFKVGDGKDQKLREGQVIRSDGWLVNPDGSVQPVFDHVAIKEGRAILVRDGQPSPLGQTMVFPNNLSVAPDGNCVLANGRRLRLQDGELLRMNGTFIPGQDTASLKNGRVVVQRGGTLIYLAPVQIMGMADGTRVKGDGTVQRQNGSTIQLREGQTILIDGLIIGH